MQPGHREYIRDFAADSYAFLLRKLPRKKIPPHLETIMRTLQQNPSPEVRPPSPAATTYHPLNPLPPPPSPSP